MSKKAAQERKRTRHPRALVAYDRVTELFKALRWVTCVFHTGRKSSLCLAVEPASVFTLRWQNPCPLPIYGKEEGPIALRHRPNRPRSDHAPPIYIFTPSPARPIFGVHTAETLLPAKGWQARRFGRPALGTLPVNGRQARSGSPLLCGLLPTPRYQCGRSQYGRSQTGRCQWRERQRGPGRQWGSRTQPRLVGRQPGPQPPRTCTMSGTACTATPPASGVAFAVPGPMAAAATLTAPNTASVANFI
jgi:hypothetical protein